jgi:hypothetical protein
LIEKSQCSGRGSDIFQAWMGRALEEGQIRIAVLDFSKMTM